MMIETYTDQRKEEVVSLVTDFYNEAIRDFGNRFSVDVLYNSIERYRHHSFLLIIDGKCRGLLAGVQIQLPLSDEKIFQEVIWYVDKKYRSKGIFLLNQVMKTLKADGFNSLIMGVLFSSKTDKIRKFYEKIGFTPMEMNYIKQL